MSRRIPTLVLFGLWLGMGTVARGDWQDQVGYTRLKFLLGDDLEAAPIEGFSHVESSESESTPQFEPNTADPLFDGKSFTHKSGSSSVSGHANLVATYFYGTGTSLVSGNCPVDLYSADAWLNSGFLKTGTGMLPEVESRAVANHSWIGIGESAEEVEEIDQRLDFAINRDGFIDVAGVNNGNSTTLPSILCQGYHGISVGLSNGNHSAGLTTMDGAGRVKPDLVAPADYTSFATPMVASAAGLLFSKLTTAPISLTGADRPRVVKALLLASARHDTVASWSNTPDRPLDLRYGAGELNILHAYNDLAAGRQTASDSAEVTTRGWAAETVTAGTTRSYFFTVSEGPGTPFCAALCWHRQITTSQMFFNRSFTPTLGDLNLKLLHATGFTPGDPVVASDGTLDNLELVSQSTLAPGRYVLVVENLSNADTRFGLAWHSLPVVKAVVTQPVASESTGQSALVRIQRSGDVTLPLLVPLSTSGTATAGTDYLAIPTPVTIPAGQSELLVEVASIPDETAQGPRTLEIGIAADFALIGDGTAAVTIADKPFDSWRFGHFTAAELTDPAVSSAAADPDGDGFANLLEYALATDPTQSQPALPIATALTDGTLVLSAPKNPLATDLAWGAEVSHDLVSWDAAETTVDTAVEFAARDPAGNTAEPPRFIRLKITRP